MPIKPVISNNSPLVALWRLDLLSLLRDLYTEVWIPQEVKREFLRIEKISRQEALNNAAWIKTIDLTDSESIPISNRLDPGEASVLALGKKYDARFVIIDEKKARQEARKMGLSLKGTVGVLLDAKKNGLIDEIKPLLIALKRNGMHLNESIIFEALQQAGEM
ncbi:DUF3368 domain-containing protein [Candidatus Poribacteria bacterium]|nr:DUF3368 domain-containing protein [Candidatus Poribacteria bacterium]